MWTFLATDEPAPGVYKIDPSGELVGEWGFAGRVSVKGDGSLDGSTQHDRIYRAEPAGEPEVR